MKNGSTNFLRFVIIVLGLVVASLCIAVLPQLIASEAKGDFDYGWIFLGMYVPAVPFFIALHQALKLLKLIDKNRVFTQPAVNTLKNIKIAALGISGLYAIGMPYVFAVADRDDAPGTVAIGLIIVGASFVIAVAASLFQKLLQNAVDIKSENDLTV